MIKELGILNSIDTIDIIDYCYDDLGRLTDMIQESPKSDVYYTDVISWSKHIHNRIHIKYSNFDKHGNWTKSYFVTKKGKVFRSKRKIDYWKSK
jgi:hypothetical protein